MADVLTVIVVLVLTIALLITNIYILVYFCHPDDKGSTLGWILKILVIIGLTLSWIQVLMLPLDVSNNRTFGGGLNMRVFWYTIYILTIIYILLISRISMGFYESDDTWSVKEIILNTLVVSLFTSFLFFVIGIILFYAIGTSEIPIRTIQCNYSEKIIHSNLAINDDASSGCQIDDDNEMEIDVDFVVYLIGFFLFFSWILFAIFGGIGLASVPIEYFYRFSNRPKHMKSTDVYKRRGTLLQDVENLRILGDKIKNLEAKGYNKKCKCSSDRRYYEDNCNQFRAGYMIVDKEFEILNAHEEARKQGNCVYVCYYLLLPLGIFCMLMTLLWMIQFSCSFFYIKYRRPGYPFLSYMFIFFQDHDVAFLSFFFFALFCLYLLFCTVKGNFRFGIRIFCCWDIYPMKKEGTYMDSFIFNIRLVLYCSFAIIHFCAESFTDYVAFTDVDVIFNVQIKYLKLLKYFYKYHIFHYLFFIIFAISLIYLILNPSDEVKRYKGGSDFNNISGDKINNNTNNIITSISMHNNTQNINNASGIS